MPRTVAVLNTLLALLLPGGPHASMRNVILIIGDGFDDRGVCRGVRLRLRVERGCDGWACCSAQ